MVRTVGRQLSFVRIMVVSIYSMFASSLWRNAVRRLGKHGALDQLMFFANTVVVLLSCRLLPCSLRGGSANESHGRGGKVITKRISGP